MTTTNSHHYFAIASMMNPVSLANRGLKPLKSQPAVLLDYKLVFFGTMGFAEAVPSAGSTDGFHGVVHTVTQEDLRTLTDLEGHLYKAQKATARLYDGTLLSDVVVFCRPDERLDGVGIPHERYLNIMMEGAAHYGVQQGYIDSLAALEQEPRPKPQDFWSMGPVSLSDLPAMSLEDAMKLDGQEDRPLAATVNGKVFAIQNPTMERSGLFRKMRKKHNSPAVEDFMPKTLYDPVYGVPTHRNDCTRQHAAYLEHLVLQRLGKEGGVKLIASVPQSYKEE